MKKLILLLSCLLLFISCKKQSGQINIVLDEQFGKRLFEFNIYSEDTVVYKSRIPINFNGGDTIIFRKLPEGRYKISYLDILGKTKVTNVNLTGGDTTWIKPEPNIVNVESFFSNTPINNIKDDQQYIIKMEGGSIATMEGWYTITKEKGQIYFKPTRGNKILLSKDGVKAVEQFEAQLLAINNIYICHSTDRLKYTIIQNKDTLEIIDNTCMWNGWNVMSKKIIPELTHEECDPDRLNELNNYNNLHQIPQFHTHNTTYRNAHTTQAYATVGMF